MALALTVNLRGRAMAKRRDRQALAEAPEAPMVEAVLRNA